MDLGLASAISGALFNTFIGWSFSFVQEIIINLITLFGSMVQFLIQFPLNVDVVRNSWEIVRNFANMLFIIALIVMAFGTIFNRPGYDFRSLIVNFLIAALLINFSLSICELIVGIFDSLNRVFNTSIGDVGNRFAEASRFGKLLGTNLEINLVSGIEAGLLKTLISVVAQNIILLIALFSIFVLFIFVFIRIPVMWALMIVSPVAWITYILPSTRNINRMWWKYFLGWNMFMPLYFFFIYFGLYFMQQGSSIIPSAGTDHINAIIGNNLGVTVQDIFFYALTAGFIVGGAKFAMGTAMSSGAGAVAMGTWARGVAATRWTGAAPYRLARFGLRTSGIEGAAKDRWDQFKKEGFTGTRFEGTPLGLYQGKEGLDRAKAGWAERFGVRGAAEKQMPKDVESAKYKMRTVTDLDELKGMTQEGPDYKRLAAFERISELRDLTADEITEAYSLYGGTGSVNARRFIEGVDPKKFSKENRDKLYELGDLRLKQKIAWVRADLGDFVKIKDSSGNVIDDEEQAFLMQATLFTSEADKATFVRKAKDYLERLRPDQRHRLYDDTEVTGEMKKELAMMLAEKGDFGGVKGEDGEILPGSVEKELAEAARLFEGKNQQTALLSKAQKKYMAESLRVKSELGLFGPDTDYGKELKREVSKLDNEEILALSKGSLSDPDMVQALIGTINEKRIGPITRSNKADGVKLNILNDKVFSQIRINAVNADKVKPLEEYRDRVRTLVGEVGLARGTNNTSKLGLLKSEADQIQKKTKKIYDDLLSLPFATTDQKEAANGFMSEIKSSLDSLKRFQNS